MRLFWNALWFVAVILAAALAKLLFDNILGTRDASHVATKVIALMSSSVFFFSAIHCRSL